jgi:hypothetical protein
VWDQTLDVAVSPDGATVGITMYGGNGQAALVQVDTATFQILNRTQPTSNLGCQISAYGLTYTNTGRALLFDDNCNPSIRSTRQAVS